LSESYSARSVQLIRLAVLATAGLAAFAQTQTGSVSGPITDAHGAAVPGVSVDATSQSTGTTVHAISSEAGLYVFPSLASGLWTISAEKAGFKKLFLTDIEIFIAQRQTLDLQL